MITFQDGLIKSLDLWVDVPRLLMDGAGWRGDHDEGLGLRAGLVPLTQNRH